MLHKGRTYHEAVQEWLSRHHKKTIFCLVQFKNVDDSQMPRMYLASPEEIAEVLCREAGGRGDTILYEHHEWGPTAKAWEGSFFPRLPGGKRKKFNVYAETKEQCEIKLAEMIERVKAEIVEEKAKLKEDAD